MLLIIILTPNIHNCCAELYVCLPCIFKAAVSKKAEHGFLVSAYIPTLPSHIQYYVLIKKQLFIYA